MFGSLLNKKQENNINDLVILKNKSDDVAICFENKNAAESISDIKILKDKDVITVFNQDEILVGKLPVSSFDLLASGSKIAILYFDGSEFTQICRANVIHLENVEIIP